MTAHYTHHPDNIDLLLSSLLYLKDVVFVTLNYDTLLESRLEIFWETGRFNSPDTYIADSERGWSLIKLHGSLNWGYPMTKPERRQFTEPSEDLSYKQNEMEVFDVTESKKSSEGLLTLRFRSTPPPHYFYPALSVPIGVDDLLSCPKAHVDHLRDKLDRADGIDMLVIGYSANDREVLRLFTETDTPIRSTYVVNADQRAALPVLQKITSVIGGRGNVYDGSFSGFVQSGFIDNYRDNLYQ